MPNSISAMPTAMSLTRGSPQIAACTSAQQRAGTAGREHAEPRRARQVRGAVGAHRAHHQIAFEPEIDAAAALGDALAEADEQERRADAQRAAEHRDRHHPPAEEASVHDQASLPEDAEAAVERLARQHRDEDHALQHQHRGVGQAEAALQQPAAGVDAAEQDGDGDDGERIMPGEERHQDAGEAVAGREIGVGAALHGGHFDHAGEPRRGAARESRR